MAAPAEGGRETAVSQMRGVVEQVCAQVRVVLKKVPSTLVEAFPLLTVAEDVEQTSKNVRR
jgi:hypothetical protein